LWKGNEYFTGINGFFDMVRKNRYKIQFKYMLAKYTGKTTCPVCHGSRLRKEAGYVKIGGKTISELMNTSIDKLSAFFDEIKLNEYEKGIAGRILVEIKSRLGYIKEVGLGYLTLNRTASSLSGGESQRINLASSLGSSLVGSLYILDEPSIGLHPRDTDRLISVIKSLRDLGNTVIIVEHDKKIITSADRLIDIGPYAGTKGGKIVYEGTIAEGLEKCKNAAGGTTGSLTLDYIGGLRKINIPETTRHAKGQIRITGCREHNLKNINVNIPLGIFTVITGVSGSGKSTLIGDTLYPALGKHFGKFGAKPGAYRQIEGNLEDISDVEYIDQSPIGKSSRSNPVTYLKIYDDIRDIFSQQPYAKMNGYGHSFFSFNIDGGRCPQCLGEGYITIPMQFMADVRIVCEECGGKRFKPDILEVKFHGKNINDVLEMSVSEAIEFFGSQKEEASQKVASKLQVLADVGLEYIKLGQNSNTLSGGESQRIKLAQFLGNGTSKPRTKTGGILFIFDEPTTGLHFYDIDKLLGAFEALLDRGHSVIVIEHNTDVIKAADWVIDLGPEGGEGGGEICFEGTPGELALHKDNYTGKALSE
jgi:excinuclease ABC subunit A